MPKFHITGWIQATISIDEFVEADNSRLAYNKIYYRERGNIDINNLWLDVDEVKAEDL